MIVQDTMIHELIDRTKLGESCTSAVAQRQDVLKYLYDCTKPVNGISLLPVIVTLFIHLY
jgi:hypothetical protein